MMFKFKTVTVASEISFRMQNHCLVAYGFILKLIKLIIARGNPFTPKMLRKCKQLARKVTLKMDLAFGSEEIACLVESSVDISLLWIENIGDVAMLSSWQSK